MASEKQGLMPNEAVMYTPALEGPYKALLVDLEYHFNSHQRTFP